MTEPDARQISEWRYVPPYDFYDLPESAWPDLLGLGDRFLAADLPAALAPPLRRPSTTPLTRWLPRRTARTAARSRSNAEGSADPEMVLGGFVCFGHEAQVSGARHAGLYRDDALDIGLGLRPDLTGRGLGAPFFTACLDLATARAPGSALRLAVAAFNQRAITTYQRAGFVPVGTCTSPVRGHEVDFLVMVREPTAPPAPGTDRVTPVSLAALPPDAR